MDIGCFGLPGISSFLWEAENFSNETHAYDHALAKKAPILSATGWA